VRTIGQFMMRVLTYGGGSVILMLILAAIAALIYADVR